MIKWIMTSCFFIWTGNAFSQQTALAIVIDKETLSHTTAAVNAYKEMLEKEEGLHVHLLSGNWQRPEDIRSALMELSKTKPVLEGAVLIGNIPIPMVRNAQHLTTALKVDERKYTLQRTAVPTDRFYDDFDLQFRFVKQDEKNTALFYYELEETCPQIIRSDIYTSRILSYKEGNGRYDDINRYLLKAVSARKIKEPLDQLLSFTGAAYNSASLAAWLEEKPALEELFPQAFTDPSRNHYLNFRMEPFIKARLFSELQRKGLDMAIMTAHGEKDLQHLSPIPPAEDWEDTYANLQFLLRSDYRKAVRRGQKPEAYKQAYQRRYGIPESWYDGVLENDSLQLSDSLFNAAADIVTTDVEQLSQQARVIILNACGNAAIQHPDNIANAYLFNNGNTLVVQGNTINVLQDKWVLQQMGALHLGVRAGLWSYRINTLESQLLGDPTWHFAPPSANTLNTQLVLQRENKTLWQSLLQGKTPALQTIALQQFPVNAPLLLKTFQSSPSANVRMQCLYLAVQTNDTSVRRQILTAALQDNYELVRRKAADWIAKDGSSYFITPLVTLALQRPDDERVMYNVYKALALMDWDRVYNTVNEQVNAAGYLYNRASFLSKWQKKIESDKTTAHTALEKISNNDATEEVRIQAIRSLRNGNYHPLVPELVEVALNKNTPPLIRQHLFEAFGWFTLSYQKDKLLAACNTAISNSNEDKNVQQEAEQTKRRLQQWILH